MFQHLDMPWMGIWCTLTLLRLCRSGVEFRKIGVGRSLSDVVMSWLRLQTHLESIPHAFHMYTKCFSTLICCGWAYGCALTLLRLCMARVEFRKIGVGRSLSDVVISWLRLQTWENIGKAKPIAATHVKIINEWTTITKLVTKY